MGASGFTVLALLVFGYGLIARRLRSTPLSGPMVFAAAGVLLGPVGLDLFDVAPEEEVIRILLEITLALVLFTDASQVGLRAVRDEVPIAGRLLGIGLPLTIVLGSAAAALILTELSLAEAAIVGVILAPTDAALGQAVVANERVPERIRHALTVESGLNDGLVVPIFGLAIAWAEAELEASARIFVEFGADLAIAAAVGIALGWIGGRVVVVASERRLMGPRWRAVAPAALAVACLTSAEGLGASGFIAAFVAGALFGTVTKGRYPDAVVFIDDSAHLLTMLSFFVFGAAILSPAIAEIGAGMLLYAALSLTVVRFFAVAAASIGSRVERPTVAYLAWFGPRGLASIVFATTVVIETDLPGAPIISLVMAATVTASIVLHGATAWLGSNAYADWWSAMGAGGADMVEAGPVRAPVWRGRLGMD